jgi:hypothetical protein
VVNRSDVTGFAILPATTAGLDLFAFSQGLTVNFVCLDDSIALSFGCCGVVKYV